MCWGWREDRDRKEERAGGQLPKSKQLGWSSTEHKVPEGLSLSSEDNLERPLLPCRTLRPQEQLDSGGPSS